MFLSWHFILFLLLIIFDLVFGNAPEINNKTHDVTKNHTTVAAGQERKTHLNRRRDNTYDESSEKDSADKDEDYEFLDNKKSDDDGDDGDDGGDADDGGGDGPGDEETELKKRALQSGDTFTPMEFLPIATKLLAKVEPGEGRGIVTGSKVPEELADKLFAAYFLTSRRIVELTNKDLSGLDALTALALEGEVVRLRSSGDSLTEKPTKVVNMNGQFIAVDGEPLRCRYKLLFKKVSPEDAILRKGQRNRGTTTFNKILKMEKNMRPNRHLVVNHKKLKLGKVRANNNAGKGQKMELVKKNPKLRNKIIRQKVDTVKDKKSDNNKLGTKLRANNDAAEEQKTDLVKNNTTQQNEIIRQKVDKAKDKKSDNNKLDIKLRASNDAAEEQKTELVINNTTQQNKIIRQKVDKDKKSVRKRKSKKKRKHRKNKKHRKHKKSKKHHKLRSNNTNVEGLITTTAKPVCRWRYICQNSADLDTCRLHTSCFGGANNEPMLDKTIVDTKEKETKAKEKDMLIMHFRKMLGISAIDEAVEKIIEQHVMMVKPENLAPDEKIETLDEYFNNIIMAVEAAYTPPTDIHKLDDNNLERQGKELESAEALRDKADGKTVSEYTTINDGLFANLLRGKKKKVTSDSNVRKTQKFHGRVKSTDAMKSSTSKYKQ